MLACSQKPFLKICFNPSAMLSIRELYAAKILGSKCLIAHLFYSFPLLVTKRRIVS